ncbi:MAG: hypothetical protein SFT81_08195 [Candidatus Caenarcaniphilales bacterium]|nr:hypothetical protein [Candidatus Caenarcaniphilales bacterium]
MNDKYVFLTQIGKQDPWSDWNSKSLEEAGSKYGAVLRTIQQHKLEISHLIMIITSEIQKDAAAEKLIEEVGVLAPEITCETIETGIVEANNYDEIDQRLYQPLKEIAKKYEKFYIGQTSGTPQITLYLNTLFQIGMFGTPYKDSFCISVNDPRKDPDHKVVLQRDAKQEPIRKLHLLKDLVDLIKIYEYQAAMKLSTDSAFSKVAEDLRSLTNLLSLQQKAFEIFDYKILEELEKETKIKLFYLWIIEIHERKKEVRDAVLKSAFLVESIAIEFFKMNKDCKHLFTEDVKINESRLSECQKARISAVWKERSRSDSDYKFTEGDILPGWRQAFTYLEAFKDPVYEKLKGFSELPSLRNKLAHRTSLMSDDEVNKALSIVKKLKGSFSRIYPETDSPVNQNFFDYQNKQIIHKLDASWMLKD